MDRLIALGLCLHGSANWGDGAAPTRTAAIYSIILRTHLLEASERRRNEVLQTHRCKLRTITLSNCRKRRPDSINLAWTLYGSVVMRFLNANSHCDSDSYDMRELKNFLWSSFYMKKSNLEQLSTIHNPVWHCTSSHVGTKLHLGRVYCSKFQQYWSCGKVLEFFSAHAGQKPRNYEIDRRPALIVAMVLRWNFLCKNKYGFFKVTSHGWKKLYTAVIGIGFQGYQSCGRGLVVLVFPCNQPCGHDELWKFSW